MGTGADVSRDGISRSDCVVLHCPINCTLNGFSSGDSAKNKKIQIIMEKSIQIGNDVLQARARKKFPELTCSLAVRHKHRQNGMRLRRCRRRRQQPPSMYHSGWSGLHEKKRKAKEHRVGLRAQRTGNISTIY